MTYEEYFTNRIAKLEREIENLKRSKEVMFMFKSPDEVFKNWLDFYRFENRCLLEENQRLIEIIKSDKKLYKQHKNKLGL